MTVIIASILTTIILIGTSIPIVSNIITENALKENFGSPKIVKVNNYSNPSYKMFFGRFDRSEINIKNGKINDISFEEIKGISFPTKLDYSKLNNKNLDFIESSKFEVLLVLNEEQIRKMIDLKVLTVQINKFLGEFKLPIPALSGNVSVNNLNLGINDNSGVLEGTIIALGGFLTMPFKVSGNLLVNNKNKLNITNPEIYISGNKLPSTVIKQISGNLKPVFDLDVLNTKNQKITVSKAYFKNKKLMVLGTLAINN